jgi:DNA primase
MVTAIEFRPGGDELAKVLHYYNLLEDGSEFKIVCPFHDDINASMKVDLVTGTFFCFGCHVSGDALKFVMLVDKRHTELGACKRYYKILRSGKVKGLKVVKHARNRPSNKQALVIAKDFYFGLKTTDWVDEVSAEKDYMLQRGFTDEALNLCRAKYTYGVSYPMVFPMFDLGVFKGWVCRTTNKRIEAKRKYLYNEGFSRRDTLVGNYSAKVVVLVEGYMDWLKFRMFGVKHVAAILGWKATEQQITKLKKQGVEYIISALDNDRCGKDGTKYLKQFFKVVRFRFPEGIKDPGEMNQATFDKANAKTKRKYKRRVLKDGSY